MAGAGVFEGDVVAIKRNHAPEPGRWTTGTTPRRVRADADNVTMIGVETALTTTARSRERREREMVRARKGAERGLGIE